MARRDLRRHKGRSALVFLMVALPTGLLVGLAGLADSQTVSGVDRIPLTLGPAQALVQGPDPTPVLQGGDPDSGASMVGGQGGAKATPIPSLDTSVSLGAPSNVAAVKALTGASDVVRTGYLPLRHVMGDKSRPADVFVFDPGTHEWGDKAHLTSGRWAKDASEVVVTPLGVSRGMPASGTVTLRTEGKDYTVTVVGTAEVFMGWAAMPDAVSPQPVATDSSYSWSWLVFRDRPLTYADVRHLNTYGLRVTSAHVLRHPPTQPQLPPELRQQTDWQAQQLREMVVVGAVMLLVVTTLLVAPAFAVSAARQRRTLALAASNGAETRQLRRKVLSQAVVLGGLSAVVSAVLALLALRLGILWWVHHQPWTMHRYFSVPVVAVLFIVGCSVVSTLVAALIPALRLDRLDIVGVMRGQSVSPRLNRVLPVVGLALAVGGGAALLWAVRTEQHELPVAGSGIVLVLGALMLVPLCLVVAGRLAAPLPVAPRMATRDAARHRSRSVPTVAAIMAGTIALTIFSVSLASDTRQRQHEYLPQAPMGEGTILYAPFAGGTSQRPYDADTRELVERVSPHLRTTSMSVVGSDESFADGDPVPFVALMGPGCTPEQAMEPGGARGCTAVGAFGSGQIGVLPETDLTRLAHLAPTQVTAVRHGAVVIADKRVVSGGTVRVAKGTITVDQQTGIPKLRDATESTVPAVVASTGYRGSGYPAFVTPETARKLGWPTTPQSVLIHDPNGPISTKDQKALKEAVGDEGHVYVERGFVRDDVVIMQALFGGFALLVLIVTLVSTALALSEQRADLGTFAAVGATRRTRRALAAAQAVVVGLVGAVLGIAVGLVPGIAMTYPLTSQSWDQLTHVEKHVPPTIVIPWLPLVAVVVGVPLLAGLLSAAAIRKAPTMTRRAD
jgi:putative ABC transport system permease protein